MDRWFEQSRNTRSESCSQGNTHTVHTYTSSTVAISISKTNCTTRQRRWQERANDSMVMWYLPSSPARTQDIVQRTNDASADNSYRRHSCLMFTNKTELFMYTTARCNLAAGMWPMICQQSVSRYSASPSMYVADSRYSLSLQYV